MRLFKYIISFLYAFTRNDDGGNRGLNQFNSQICTSVIGLTVAYWDSTHGLSMPLSVIPTIANPGQQFIHPQYLALGFIMPQG